MNTSSERFRTTSAHVVPLSWQRHCACLLAVALTVGHLGVSSVRSAGASHQSPPSTQWATPAAVANDASTGEAVAASQPAVKSSVGLGQGADGAEIGEIGPMLEELAPPRFSDHRPVFRVQAQTFTFDERKGRVSRRWHVVRDGDRVVALITGGGIHLLAKTPEDAPTQVTLHPGRWHIDTFVGAVISGAPCGGRACSAVLSCHALWRGLWPVDDLGDGQ